MKITTERFYEMSIESPDPRMDDTSYDEEKANFLYLVHRLLEEGIPCKVYCQDVGRNIQTYEFSYHEDRKSIVDEILTEMEDKTHK